ncbi:MAG: DUF4199 domain-containing protein [Bacteroidota bacterium]
MTTVDNPSTIPDPSNVSMRPTAMKYGLYGGLVSVVFALIFYVAGVTDPTQQGGAGNTIGQLVGVAVLVAAIIMALKHHKENELGGYLTMGRSIGLGVLVSLVMAVIGIIWMFLFFHVIDPGLLDAIKESAYEQALERGTTEEQLEAAQGMMEFFTSTPFFAMVSLIFSVIIGLIASAIAGAVMKKDPPMI